MANGFSIAGALGEDPFSLRGGKPRRIQDPGRGGTLLGEDIDPSLSLSPSGGRFGREPLKIPFTPPTYPQPGGPGTFTTPLSQITVPTSPSPEALGTVIPPDVEEFARSLTDIGERDIARQIQQFGMNFAGGDLVASARDRAMALLASELGRNLLSTTLGLRAQEAGATRARLFDAFIRQLLQTQAIRAQEAPEFIRRSLIDPRTGRPVDEFRRFGGDFQTLTPPRETRPTPAQIMTALLGGFGG